MKRNYDVEIHDLETDITHVYEIFATSFEDAFLQAKVLHNHYMHLIGRKAELTAIKKKQNNENE